MSLSLKLSSAFALVLVLSGCAAMEAGLDSAGRRFPDALGKLADNPSMGGLVNLAVTLGTAFVTGVATYKGGQAVERKKAKKKGCARCGCKVKHDDDGKVS